MTTHRKLAAILSADAAGYSRLMADDEAETLRALNESRALFRKRIEAHGGRLIDTAGDSVLAEFPSAVEAVDCAVEIQHELAKRNSQLAEHRRMQFRIGINLGDVIEQEDGTIYGDGVNVAARLQQLAEPGGICVSGTAFDQVEGKLPLAFKSIGEQQVKNIAKAVRAYWVVAQDQGGSPVARAKTKKTLSWRAVVGAAVAAFVLVAGVSIWWDQRAFRGDPVASAAGASIAVLPFENLSGDPSQEFFADGVTDEIVTTLSRFQSFRVAARHNTFRYKGKAVDTRTVGNELRVRYVLSGSVRKTADTVRVTAQLIQAESGSQIWAENYQRPLTAKNIFDIQQDLSLRIVTAIGGGSGVLISKEYSDSQAKAPTDLTAYECFMRWMGGYGRTLSNEDHRVVVDCLEHAVELDPSYAELWAALAMVYVEEYRFGYNPRPGAPLDRALTAAERAVLLAPQSQLAYRTVAHTRFFRGERDAFFTAVERAVQLNPNEPNTLAALGTWVCYAGQWEKGIAMVNKALALDPLPLGWYYFPIFFDHYRKGEYEAALAAAQKIDMPNFLWAQAALVAAYGQLGRAGDAKATIKRILELNPNFEATARQDRWKFFRYQEPLLDQFMDGLRKAGLQIPEKS